MTPHALKALLGVSVVVAATGLTPLTAPAQTVNTTIQEGRVNINRTYQVGGDSTTNTTSQTGMININRTLQLGGTTGDPAGLTGQRTPPGLDPGRGDARGRALGRGVGRHSHPPAADQP